MNVIRLTREEHVICERQAKFIQERIVTSENNLSSICNVFGNYIKKLASLRDKSDDIAVALNRYSDSEEINKSLKICLKEIANIVVLVGDYRDILIHNLEKKVVEDLCQYDVICRNARSEVKNIFSAKDRELKKRRHLSNVRQRAPQDRKQINKAEADLVKTVAEVSSMQKSLEEHVEVFEKKKVKDVKVILKDFIQAEIAFHASAIKLYTNAFSAAEKIDESGDLEAFRSVLKEAHLVNRLQTVKLAKPPLENANSNRSIIGNFLGKREESKNSSNEDLIIDDFANDTLKKYSSTDIYLSETSPSETTSLFASAK